MAVANALKPFHNDASVEVGDISLRLVIDFHAIDVIEALLGEGMDQVLPRLLAPNPPHALAGKVLWAMLREHHSEVTLDQVAGILYSPEHGPRVGLVAGDLVRRAFNIGDATEGRKGARPPRRSRGASRPSSRSGSQPG